LKLLLISRELNVIRVRFHGRGGHGVKTASRIVGAAAFSAGWQAQDSPIYGAERRGAAVTAFTRMSQEPIRERGVIEQPDLIIVGDETLLADPGAGVLVGQEGASGVFVNTSSAGQLAEEFSIVPPVVTLDVAQMTLDCVGRASALSVGLAAAAARLGGAIEEEQLLAAAEEELASLGVTVDVIEKNLLLARRVYAALAPIVLRSREPAVTDEIWIVGEIEPPGGAPSVLAAGNAVHRRTGLWRLQRPDIDYDLCTRCGLCFVLCPDGAIAMDEEYPVIDYDHCKGCMICAHQCPVRGILRHREVRSW
jgi:pyruvate ferredoxin oxidoreductase gamma subunit